MSACEEVNKYGLREYSFEIGPMDDSGETVAIVGQEYSSVSEDEKFYSKEDVDFLIAEKDKEIRHRKRKWCLDMANRCKTTRDEIIERTPTSILSHPTEYLTRWENRWLALAEKFKEDL